MPQPFICRILFQNAILLLVYRLIPLGPSTLAGDLYGQVLEPGILGRTVPVLHTSGGVHYITGAQLSRLLAPFLIPAPATDADQHLSAAVLGVMDVPVVPAPRFKGHVEYRHLLFGQRCKVALPNEIWLFGRMCGWQIC